MTIPRSPGPSLPAGRGEPGAGARPAAPRSGDEDAEADRVLAVMGGLMVAGAVAGAVATVLAVAAATLATYGPRQLWLYPAPLVVGGMLGAAVGAFLGPLAAWLLMRHVPLGIAIGGTMLGTTVGGVAALLLEAHFFTLPIAGFAAAALVIRLAVPSPERVRVQGD